MTATPVEDRAGLWVKREDAHRLPSGVNGSKLRACQHLIGFAATPGAYHLTYGIAPPASAGRAEIEAFHAVGADQVTNLPEGLATLVIPFGSGNTAATVLYGLSLHGPVPPRIVLAGIGPDRRAWLAKRLELLGVDAARLPIEHLDLHGTGYATYGQKMPETLDGIRLHPTYEGKVARYLNERRPPWWTARDSSTCLWIVGGPL